MNQIPLIGWTLVHSMWELAACGLLLLLARTVFRTPRIRYLVGLIALAGCLLAPLATYAVLRTSSAPESLSTVSTPPLRSAPSVQAEPLATRPSVAWTKAKPGIEDCFPLLIRLWIFGLALMSLRLIGGLFAILKLKRASKVCQNEAIVDLGNQIAKRLGSRRSVIVRISENLDGPAMIGLFRSVILLPAAIVTKMEPAHIEAILAHEIAHVRRFDYLANLIQSLVETVGFYHPAVWWISHIIWVEREHCCDELALTVISDRTRYAMALVEVEKMRAGSPRLALAANGGSLLDRVRHIVGGQATSRTAPWAGIAALVAISFGVACAQQLSHLDSAKGKRGQVTVRGQVLSASGEPVAGAFVTLEAVDLDAYHLRTETATADPDGRFMFEHGTNERAAVIAFAKGKGIAASDGPIVKDATIRLQPMKSVQALIVNEDGSPVSGIEVGPTILVFHRFAYQEPEELFHKMAGVTDKNGNVIVSVTASNQDIGIADTRYSVTSVVHPTAADPKIPLQKLTLGRAGTIDGVVTANGRPVANLAIVASNVNGSLSRNIYSDQDGRFELTNLPNRTIRVEAFLPDDLAKEWCTPTATIGVRPGIRQQLELKMVRGELVSGRVVDSKGNPLERAWLQITSSHETAPLVGPRVAKDGTFHVRLRAGRYQMIIRRGETSSEHDFEVVPNQSKILNLTAADTVPVQCLVLRPDGKPAAGILVEYSFRGIEGREEMSIKQTNDQGVATVEVAKNDANTVRFSARERDEFSEYELAPTDGKAVLHLHKRALSTIQGVVKDLSGHPLANVKVSIGLYGPRGFAGDLEAMGSPSRITGPDGRYSFRGVMGGEKLIVMAENIHYVDFQSTTMRSGTSNQTTMPDILLQPGRTIKGRVVDKAGHPVQNATLIADNVTRVRGIFEHTDTQGRFKLDRIPPSLVTLRIFDRHKETKLQEIRTGNGTYVLQ